jgi:hypothetical protein
MTFSPRVMPEYALVLSVFWGFEVIICLSALEVYKLLLKDAYM